MKTKSMFVGLLLSASALMNAQEWQVIGDQADMTGSINSIAVSKNNNMVYSAGLLKYGSLPNNQVFKWDFTEWAPVGNLGLATSIVNKLVLDNTEKIYIIGDFKDPTGKYYVRFWNGTEWNALGTLKSSTMFNDIATDGINVYVAGTFVNTSNGENCYINKWDGTSWSVVTASNFNGVVRSIAIDSQKNVLVGGDMRNTLNQYGVFKIANGVNSEVGKLRSLSPIQTILVNKANDNVIAETGGRYNYNPMNNTWTQLTPNSGFVAMDYEEAGHYIVKYPNTNMYSQIYTNNVNSSNSIFMGTGLFARDCKFDKFGYAVCGSGGKILRWTQKIGGLATSEIAKPKILAYPNPSTGIINVSYSERISDIEVYDMTGKLILKTLPVSNTVQINLEKQIKGIYLLKIKSNDQVFLEKIILK